MCITNLKLLSGRWISNHIGTVSLVRQKWYGLCTVVYVGRVCLALERGGLLVIMYTVSIGSIWTEKSSS